MNVRLTIQMQVSIWLLKGAFLMLDAADWVRRYGR